MSDSLIREAARRGRTEAERRDLQDQIDEAYHAEVEKVERRRRKKWEREQAARQAKERATTAGRNLFYTLLQIGWFGLCIAIAIDQTWQTIPALDNLFWDKGWLAYVGLFMVFIIGRKFMLDLLGFTERR